MRLPATAEESSDSAPSPQTTCWGGRVGRARHSWVRVEGGEGWGRMGRMELTASRLMGYEDGEPQKGMGGTLRVEGLEKRCFWSCCLI